MITLHLLIVEDDESMITNYTLSIKGYNNEHQDIEVTPHIKRNLQEGLEALRTQSYDGAIVDINLSGDDINGQGNQILKQIRENLRFPVRIITGYPQNIDESYRKENVLWKIYRRTDIAIGYILDEFIDIYKSGILNLLGKRGKIEKYLKKIFWTHIADNYDDIMRYTSDTDSEKVFLRYISTYLLEYMDINDANFDELYTPPEFYIKPPVRQNFFTGDLIKYNDTGEISVILTPACDMVIRENGTINAEKFLCASIYKWRDIDNDFMEITKSTGRNNNRRKKLVDHMDNKKERFHFIPPYRDIPAGFIDFQTVISLTKEEIEQKYERIATISRVFIRDIIARFSRYYARQGQPDMDTERILREMLDDS